ncbi:MAG: hypothetical protein ACP5N3_01865 [Candidatus Nanoarchaeia archaeon]
MRRAQVSMEYLAVFSFAAMMTIPLILIFSIQSSNLQKDVASAQSYKVLSKIADSAEEVYYQGPPAKKTIRITFPEGIDQVVINSSYIEFVFLNGESEIPITKDSRIPLKGTLKDFPGEHTITLTAESDGVLLEDK